MSVVESGSLSQPEARPACRVYDYDYAPQTNSSLTTSFPIAIGHTVAAFQKYDSLNNSVTHGTVEAVDSSLPATCQLDVDRDDEEGESLQLNTRTTSDMPNEFNENVRVYFPINIV